jgi:transcriptional antiterminator NusG
MSDKQWYTIHTYSGHENKVKTNLERAMHVAELEDSFGQIVVPIEQVVEIKDGVKKTTKRKKFLRTSSSRWRSAVRRATSCRTSPV